MMAAAGGPGDGEIGQVLADADRRLVRSGWLGEAEALAGLFELLEDRLSGPARPAQPGSGRYSIDRELTQ